MEYHYSVCILNVCHIVEAFTVAMYVTLLSSTVLIVV